MSPLSRQAECVFPDPVEADENGLLAAGGNLEPQTLLHAYHRGIFPWYEEGGPILWWSPDPRMVLFPEDFHCSRRLARRLRQTEIHITMDVDFSGVLAGCAQRQEGTWLFPEMMQAYQRLFDLGYARSVEVWKEGVLVGGLYGVHIGRIFFAESMFSRVTDASKMALAQLVRFAQHEGWQMIDCQFHTEHLASLGAVQIPRSRFMNILAEGLEV